MKKKNIGKKKLTAMGAVVAAGLTPGIMAASANQGSNAGMTAADVVAIDGTAYSFDELLAMQRGDTVESVIELPDIILQPNETQEDMLVVYAQRATKYGVPVIEKEPVSKPATNEIFRSVEQMPQFPGGEAALMKYIQSHLKYPENAAKNNIEGRVVVQMVIDSIGQVGEVKVVRSVEKELDKEAIRVCKSLPKFTPGRQNGKAVSVWYTLPITFKIQQKNVGQP